MKSVFNNNDYDEADFFKFGRAALTPQGVEYAEHAMYDIYYTLDREAYTYNLMKSTSQPSLFRPSFKRSLSYLDEVQKKAIVDKYNLFLEHLKSTEGLDFFNAFLIVSPTSILQHVHSNIVFEQTYVLTQSFGPAQTQFHIGVNKEDPGYSFLDFPEEDFFVRLPGDPIPHEVITKDNNLKFYFVFEFNREPKTSMPFRVPIKL